jgi:multiple sugar transport system substrate-binding protein
VTAGHSYVGLTWDHPRGYVALERAAQQARAHGLSLRWERQPLEGFEAHPIEDLAAKYDLIVLDHPHMGDAVAAECLQPLEDLFEGELLQRWSGQSIGQTFASYRYGSRHWALPLDAAAQVSAARLDRLESPVPATWPQVLELARRRPVALSLAGPHAILTLFSICAGCGTAPASNDPAQLLEREAARAAWELLRELYSTSFHGWAYCNPIQLLEQLARTAEAVYCPLVFGYVNYAVPAADRTAVQFFDAPAGPSGRRGSVLGGTGLAVSRRARVDTALRSHLIDLLSPRVQQEFIPFADGQPSGRSAWSDARVNEAWRGFFANTRETIEAAIVRPRHPHYVEFQAAASQAVRDALSQRVGAEALIDALQALYGRFRPAGSEV